jgi:hypothetical protein
VRERLGDGRRERGDLFVDLIERSVEPAQQIGNSRAEDEDSDADQQDPEAGTHTENKMRPIDL